MDSTYTRVLGGTTMHWEGKAMRMLPEDFQMRTRFGQGRDWPIGYDDLEPHYRQAERELGVSADVADQTFYGITFPPGYVFPMHGLPPSYLDTDRRSRHRRHRHPARGHHLHDLRSGRRPRPATGCRIRRTTAAGATSPSAL